MSTCLKISRTSSVQMMSGRCIQTLLCLWLQWNVILQQDWLEGQPGSHTGIPGEGWGRTPTSFPCGQLDPLAIKPLLTLGSTLSPGITPGSAREASRLQIGVGQDASPCPAVWNDKARSHEGLVVNNDSSVRNPSGFAYFCMCRKRSRVILFVAYKNDGLNSSPLSSFKQIKIRGVLAALWRWECKVGCRDLQIRKKNFLWYKYEHRLVNYFNQNDLRCEMTLDLQWSYSKALSHSACVHAKSLRSCLTLRPYRL